MTWFRQARLLMGRLGWRAGAGRLLQLATESLGRRHLAGLCLGGSGGDLIVSQWAPATAQGGEHAVPELEGRA